MPVTEFRSANLPTDSAYAADFAGALLDPGRATPAAVIGPHGKGAVKRYNVYRNNVTVSLINALAAIYPTTRRLAGEDFFRAMARFHAQATPPRSPLLFEYGHDFPDFISNYAYARTVPWLADVARIERAWLDAYHAADAAPLPPQQLAGIAEERLDHTRFAPHPATRIVRSRFPAISIFIAYRDSEPAEPVSEAEPEDALLTRPGLEVEVRRLPAGGAVFLARLLARQTLAEAAAAALNDHPAFDLATNIAGMLTAGAFSAIEEEE